VKPGLDDMTFLKDWFKSLLSENRRNAPRQDAPQLQAYYLEGGPATKHDIRDISFSGLYLQTSEDWYPGTLVTLTLQKTGSMEDDPERAITVQGQVVRSEKDGVGLRFVLPNAVDSQDGDLMENRNLRGADRKKFTDWMQQHVMKKDQETDGG